MSEPRVGQHVDGPVVEGGEYFLIKTPNWSAFDTDRVNETPQAAWDRAARLAVKNPTWVVMWVVVDE